MSDSLLLTSIEKGSVTAPAGCGKTHLIAETLKTFNGKKPILVLTHTNAGVASLHGRLKKMAVPSHKYKLYTLDGFFIRLISTFPESSRLRPNILEFCNPSVDYPAIRDCAHTLLSSGNIDSIIQGSYSHIIVDEYQDCNLPQHSIVCLLASLLPACVLGDPMQAIFNFGKNVLVNWDVDVISFFPTVCELRKPWRWCNAAADPLGDWLLDARTRLMNGNSIDLRTLPDYVVWHKLQNDKSDPITIQKAVQTSIPGKKARALILCDSTNPKKQQELASRTPGAVTVENVNMTDLVTFGQNFKSLNASSLEILFGFIQSVMKNANIAELNRRLRVLLAGTARKEQSKVEQYCLEFIRAPSYDTALNIIQSVREREGAALYRPIIYSGCLQALRLVISGKMDIEQAVHVIRERYRQYGRQLPMRGIGSTLLLKGLEADIAVITNPNVMDSKNLYVAITRGSERLVVCSPKPVLTPLH